MRTVDVGQEFSTRLANRNALQGDGQKTAVEFRTRFLRELDHISAWGDASPFICLDFGNVKRIGPSFANEAFAYFCQYAPPDKILRKIVLKNIDEVDTTIIHRELETGYKR